MSEKIKTVLATGLAALLVVSVMTASGYACYASAVKNDTVSIQYSYIEN